MQAPIEAVPQQTEARTPMRVCRPSARSMRRQTHRHTGQTRPHANTQVRASQQGELGRQLRCTGPLVRNKHTCACGNASTHAAAAPGEVEPLYGEADVRVELLAVHRKSARREEEPLEDHDQHVRGAVDVQFLGSLVGERRDRERDGG